MDPRKPIFDAVRAAAPDRSLFSDPGNVLALDNLLDAFNVARPQSTRRINAAGLEIIKEFEGLRLKAYLCPANVWTIGYGHTGPDVRPGMVITEARAEELLRADVQRFEKDVAFLAPVATDNQFSAMVSFAFNTGSDIDDDTIAEGLGDSTLLKRHLQGRYSEAAQEFGKWTKARVSGKLVELNGLVKRRAREAALYRKSAA